jgi:hypothetical protein
MSFLDVLHSYKDCGMWDNLSVDRDGSWLREGIAAGSALIAHDGSYMSTEAPDLCSAGVVLYCKTAKKWFKASVAECSPSARNYCHELLGAIMLLLILHAASSTLPLPYPPVVLHCDKRGVINHGNSPLYLYQRNSARQISFVILNILQGHHHVHPCGSG